MMQVILKKRKNGKMKINGQSKSQLQKKRTIVYLGLLLLSLALICSGIAFLTQLDYLSSYITLTHEQSESFYMFAAVFALFGLFTLNTIRR